MARKFELLGKKARMFNSGDNDTQINYQEMFGVLHPQTEIV